MTVDPDLVIIDKVLAGAQQAYAVIVEKHKRYVFTIALRILQNRAEAEEAAQDAFVKAYHHLAGFNRQSKFSTWLYRIVFNTAISYKRKNKPFFQDIGKSVIAHGQEAEGMLEKTDKRVYLQRAMANLSEADRTGLSLFYLEEFSLEEIASITGTPVNTLKVRIHRARQRLADELKSILKKEALTL